MSGVVARVIDTVVQFDSFIPIVVARRRRKTVVAGGFGRTLAVALHIELRCKRRVRVIVEIVLRREVPIGAVVASEVGFGFHVRVILTRHMVRHKVDYHFQAGLVRACHQFFKFLHTVCGVVGQVGVNIVVVAHRVWRPCLAFDNAGVVVVDAVAGVIGLRGVFEYAGVPNVRSAEFFDFGQHAWCEVTEFGAAVLRQRSVWHIHARSVGKQTCQNLINNYFVHV